MAIAIVREKESETISSLDVPYYVHDQALSPGTEMDREDAIDAAAAQGLIDQGGPADDYQFDRLAHNAARVVLRYRVATLSPLHPPAADAGSVEAGFSGIAFRGEHKLFSLGNIWKETGAPDLGGLVNVENVGFGDNIVHGYDLNPPPETDYVTYVVSNGAFTSAYRNTVSGLLFRVHNGATGTFFGRAAGSVMLVRAQARRRTDNDLELSFGFSYIPNGTVTKIGDRTIGTTVDGHDYPHALIGEAVETLSGGLKIRKPVIAWLYVDRIWPRGDLRGLALPGM